MRGLPGASGYSASKAAAINYLEALRLEMRSSGVHVATICPGFIATPMTAKNPYPMPFIPEEDDAARRIARAIDAGKSYAIIPWQMAIVGRILKILPTAVYDRLMALTVGRGPDRCIDAVGTEAHARGSVDAMFDKVKVATYLGTDRPHVLREAIMCCRKGGTVSIPGVYIGFLDKIPFGAAMNKGLTLKMGQTHVPRYHQLLLGKIEAGEIDPSFVVTHRLPLEEGPEAYRMFRDKKDGCIKVVLKP